MADRLKTPFDIPNIRWFIAFRVFFNSRFYYPVFTILFLDFGLTVAQFSVLNAVWAATIVLAEVPSGAVADIIGRKRLLNFAAGVMIFEIGIISFMPRIDPVLIFSVFLMNRVLSGLAEAAASGADEALAYDSLNEAGMADQWGRVLEVLMRYQAIGFVIAMTVGAVVYDPHLMGLVMGWVGLGIPLTQEVTMRMVPSSSMPNSITHRTNGVFIIQSPAFRVTARVCFTDRSEDSAAACSGSVIFSVLTNASRASTKVR